MHFLLLQYYLFIYLFIYTFISIVIYLPRLFIYL
jgi:hypothetical protein